MRQQFVPAVVVLALMTALLGVVYPLVVTGIAQVALENQADGSIVEHDDVPVGSSLIGQPFEGGQWFHPRPSAAGDGYDALASSGSNLGPLNVDLLATVADRVDLYRLTNGLSPDAAVPVDAVTASASGLDPHISPANAALQAPRVATARGMTLADVLALVANATEERPLKVLGDPGVNVVALNLALEAAAPMPAS